MATLNHNFAVSKRRAPATGKEAGAAVPAVSSKPQYRVEELPNRSAGDTGALWDLLHYHTKGEKELTAAQRRVLEHVAANYTLPDGFERDQEFGAHSGSSFEERVLCAYEYDQLQLREGGRRVRMCKECGEEGHVSVDCNAALL